MPPCFGNNNSETTFSGFRRLASSIFGSEHACHLYLQGTWPFDIRLLGNRHNVDSYPLQPLFNSASTHCASISFLKPIATAPSRLPFSCHGLLILWYLQLLHWIQNQLGDDPGVQLQGRLWGMRSSALGCRCHTPFREIGNEASIRVPRMFKSHAWQQYDKQMQCY
jgi:hypothetical protein